MTKSDPKAKGKCFKQQPSSGFDVIKLYKGGNFLVNEFICRGLKIKSDGALPTYLHVRFYAFLAGKCNLSRADLCGCSLMVYSPPLLQLILSLTHQSLPLSSFHMPRSSSCR